jgi:hypothetical protein
MIFELSTAFSFSRAQPVPAHAAQVLAEACSVPQRASVDEWFVFGLLQAQHTWLNELERRCDICTASGY